MSGCFEFLDIFDWKMMFIFFSLFYFSYMMLFSKMNMMKDLFLLNIEKSLPISKFSNWKIILILLFVFIFSNNLISLNSNIFSYSSLVTFNIGMGLMLWMSCILHNMNFSFFDHMKHYAPQGVPLALLSFMIMIELVSQLIRPITLVVRISINLMAGHLIMGLLSVDSVPTYLMQTVFLTLEVMVAVVQAYVMSLLLLLYFNE